MSLFIIAGTECLPGLLFPPTPPLGGNGSKFLPNGSFGGRGMEFINCDSDFEFGGVLLLGGKGIGLWLSTEVEGFGGNGGGTYLGGSAGGDGVLVLGSLGDCDFSLVRTSSSSLGWWWWWCWKGFGLLIARSGLGDDGVWSESMLLAEPDMSDIAHGKRGFPDLEIVPVWFLGLWPGDFRSYLYLRGYSCTIHSWVNILTKLWLILTYFVSGRFLGSISSDFSYKYSLKSFLFLPSKGSKLVKNSYKNTSNYEWQA